MQVECPIEGCDWSGDINYLGSHFRMKAAHQRPNGSHAQYITHEDDEDDGHKSHENPEDGSSDGETPENPSLSDTMEEQYGNSSSEEEDVVSYDGERSGDEGDGFRPLNADNDTEKQLIEAGYTEIEESDKPLQEREVR